MVQHQNKQTNQTIPNTNYKKKTLFIDYIDLLYTVKKNLEKEEEKNLGETVSVDGIVVLSI